MSINAHNAIASRDLGYKSALNLKEKEKCALMSARDLIRQEVSSGFNQCAKEWKESNNLFEVGAPLTHVPYSTPKFRMQGSFSYHTCNQPAHVPPQEIDLDDGLFMPVSYFNKQGYSSPVVKSKTYFAIIEQLLIPLCRKQGWKLITNKPSCIRVQINGAMHTDLALYSVPNKDFEHVTKSILSEGHRLEENFIMEDAVYKMLSADEIMLAHRHEDWKKSDPRKLEKWFTGAVETYGKQVRTISRCLKGWKDYQWREKNSLASIALMSAVVTVFEKYSGQIQKDRDDLALLCVAEHLPNILSNPIPNPVVDGERLDEGWNEIERTGFVSEATNLAEKLSSALNQTDKSTAIKSLCELFGPRMPNNESLYNVVKPFATTIELVNEIENNSDVPPPVNKMGGNRYA